MGRVATRLVFYKAILCYNMLEENISEGGEIMSMFVNPDNNAFQTAINSKVYVDKTGLLNFTNSVLGTQQAFICNSRPRRFGKSMAANMLAAYYSKGCDSSKLFAELAISQEESFAKYLNKYDVIHFDVQWCLMMAGSAEATVSFISNTILNELREIYGTIIPPEVQQVASALAVISAAIGNKFVIIIDEWDVLIRDDAANKKVQEEYINFLRGLFKGIEPTKYIALAYLTGILPIKKYKTQSAMNNFLEYTMLASGPLAPFVGFTEDEVLALCEKYNIDFAEVKRWYDGYTLGKYHVYNPCAVINLIFTGEFQSYWSQTGTYESIVPLINMNFDGLKTDIVTMLSGDAVPVRTNTYQNDMVSFKNKNDVMTSLIHLGYLAYKGAEKKAYIPNEEIRSEFFDALEETAWNEFIDFQKLSYKILNATLNMDNFAVAELIEQVHTEYASIIQYNDENSLSSVLAIAYLGAMQYYFKPIRELPAGRGFADFVYIPKHQYAHDYPALLVELKWNQDADTAIRQIKEKKYPSSLVGYAEEILLVGINYDKKSKAHSCVLEKLCES